MTIAVNLKKHLMNLEDVVGMLEWEVGNCDLKEESRSVREAARAAVRWSLVSHALRWSLSLVLLLASGNGF